MKRYVVTVNGNRYEVEVEEVQGQFAPVTPVAPAAPTAPAPVAQAPAAAPAPAAVQEAPAAKVAEPTAVNTDGSGEKLECPMPGTILQVNVKPGDKVAKGDVMFVLEAMKMENEIMAPRDLMITSVPISKGAAVNTGEILATFE